VWAVISSKRRGVGDAALCEQGVTRCLGPVSRLLLHSQLIQLQQIGQGAPCMCRSHPEHSEHTPRPYALSIACSHEASNALRLSLTGCRLYAIHKLPHLKVLDFKKVKQKVRGSRGPSQQPAPLPTAAAVAAATARDAVAGRTPPTAGCKWGTHGLFWHATPSLPW
jgi:hypothetical protein